VKRAALLNIAKLRAWSLAIISLLFILSLVGCSPASGTQPSQATVASLPATPVPTRPAPVVTPAQETVVEERMVELEWPAGLRLGDSEVVRLALVPFEDGYLAQAEFPEHALQTRPVPVPRPDGYELYAVARLDGVGFAIEPAGEQERFLPVNEAVAWRWTFSPRAAGRQSLAVQLLLRWVPAGEFSGAVPAPRESLVFSRGLTLDVRSFLGLSPLQAGLAGLVGLLVGGGLCLLALVSGLFKAPQAGHGEARVLVVNPSAGLAIETPPGLLLTAEEDGLLRALFGDSARLVIEREFLSGYSGARTMLVRPIRADGCADAATIVKLGPHEAIRQEWANFEAFVQHRLPPVTARIQRPPVALPAARRTAGQRAALQYTFIAEPGRLPLSLRQALLAEPDPGLLLRLFDTFGPHWWMQRRPYTFRLGQEYDRLLPPHYVLEPLEVCSRAFGPAVTQYNDPASLNLAVGDIVAVRSFRLAEQRADRRSLTLWGAPAPGRPALRLRWLAANQGVPFARVTASRASLLRDWTANFDRFGLPDPLDTLPAVLAESVAATRSVIHGDLNLENVLVGPGSLVWLIDFAETREGHPLFDFAHLESELIAHILAPRAATPAAYLDVWRSGTDPLLAAVHGSAARCLFDPARPREYHLALALACLGALKYANLNPLAKHCLYLTAADLLHAA
jgi:hypothetical protein